MKIAFWSEEDGCGTTSGMAAIASVCAEAWNKRIILFQSGNQEGDLSRRLGTGKSKNNSEAFTQDSWEELCWLAKRGKLTKAVLLSYLVSSARGRIYYLPQGEYKKQDSYPKQDQIGIGTVLSFAEQMSGMAFIDCGSGKDQLSEYLLSQADVVVVTISQERQNLDAYFQRRHAFRGKVIYLVSPYYEESLYNRKNISRLYRIGEEELAVIPYHPVFRHMSERGKIERFVRRQVRTAALEGQYDFSKELMHTAELVLRAAGGCVQRTYRAAGAQKKQRQPSGADARSCIRPPPYEWKMLFVTYGVSRLVSQAPGAESAVVQSGFCSQRLRSGRSVLLS